jgi:hypothetical protein
VSAPNNWPGGDPVSERELLTVIPHRDDPAAHFVAEDYWCSNAGYMKLRVRQLKDVDSVGHGCEEYQDHIATYGPHRTSSGTRILFPCSRPNVFIRPRG